MVCIPELRSGCLLANPAGTRPEQPVRFLGSVPGYSHFCHRTLQNQRNGLRRIEVRGNADDPVEVAFFLGIVGDAHNAALVWRDGSLRVIHCGTGAPGANFSDQQVLLAPIFHHKIAGDWHAVGQRESNSIMRGVHSTLPAFCEVSSVLMCWAASGEASSARRRSGRYFIKREG